MRLLNTTSLEMTEFWDNEIPRYAILSHTWEKEEVSFQEMQNGNAKNKAGYAKILSCCRQAKQHGLKYVWVDTCCIDKSSSAELTEAINSMYQWYQEAQTCYAYLSDVDSTAGLDLELKEKALARSRWFTRGWTLQELIAPRKLEIYSKHWDLIGLKSDMSRQLSSITGVPESILSQSEKVGLASVAARMSWASQRITTRVEDMAYCLMGIFGINMPLLYGEGRKAFLRLQGEIIKISNDHSLFAWTRSYAGKADSMFAHSPKCFSNSRYIIGIRGGKRTRPCSSTSCGLRIELVLVPKTVPDEAELSTESETYIAVLDCVDFRYSNFPIGIKMTQVSFFGEKVSFRADFDNIWTVRYTNPISSGLTLQSEVLHVSDSVLEFSMLPVYKTHDQKSQSSEGFLLYDVHPFNMWTPYKCDTSSIAEI